MAAYQLMIKPVGPSCNLNCTYCYYLPKQKMFKEGVSRMSDETLEELTRQYIGSQDGKVITFNWQGGEPTLAGLEFFRRAMELQNKYRRPGTAIENTLQTNGTLLDDEWCRFLRDNRFLVGLSIDGPHAVHDIYRKDRKGGPTCARVVQAARALREHQVQFNTLTVINRENARHPLQVYRFLRNVVGARYMQFIPCVEPKGFESVSPQGREVQTLPRLGDPSASPEAPGSLVMEWSVDPEDYGSFMIELFDEWVRRDVGKVFVINFEVALASWLGLPSAACTFAERCGNALALEHDGSVYSCDHYVYSQHRLGTIHETGLAEMVSSDRQVEFGRGKAELLPARCRECEVLFACNGECPRNRFLRDYSDRGLNYLCPGLRRFFIHIGPWMTLMAREVRAGRGAENIMLLNPVLRGQAGARPSPPLDRGGR